MGMYVCTNRLLDTTTTLLVLYPAVCAQSTTILHNTLGILSFFKSLSTQTHRPPLHLHFQRHTWHHRFAQILPSHC